MSQNIEWIEIVDSINFPAFAWFFLSHVTGKRILLLSGVGEDYVFKDFAGIFAFCNTNFLLQSETVL